MYLSSVLFWTNAVDLVVILVDTSGWNWAATLKQTDRGKNMTELPHLHVHQYEQKCPVGSSSHGEAKALKYVLEAEPNLSTMCSDVIKLTPRYKLELPQWDVLKVPLLLQQQSVSA